MSNPTKTVDLQKLVENPNSLKLLILHTPYTLEISSLWRCSNLIKLDLSKNNLERFPHIGNLCHLRFMFLHQNKLDYQILKSIFFSDDQPNYSPLSKSIVWVTYWGNKNTFFCRHFLANSTSVIAVDKFMIADEQRRLSVTQSKSAIQSFSELTDISYILQRRTYLSKNATQEQYMEEFWNQMRQLRRRIQNICSIIIIQKVFRGWAVRKKLNNSKKQYILGKGLKEIIFMAWKKQVNYHKKLFKFLQKRNKQHYLLPLKQMKLQNIKCKMIQWAARAKRKVLLRKVTLNAEIKFYHVLRSNMLMFRSLYNELEIQKSNYILLDVSNFRQFFSNIKLFIEAFNGEKSFQVADNEHFMVRQSVQGLIKKQFAQLLSINQRSYVIKVDYQKIKNQKRKKTLFNENICHLSSTSSIIKPLYKNQNKVHLNNKEKAKSKTIFTQLQKRQRLVMEDYVKVKGSTRVLKDFIRCAYFLNTKTLTVEKKDIINETNRIKLFSQRSIEKLSAVTLIQKLWKGYIFRKKQKSNAQICIKQLRAIVKIQRWIRNLPHRKRYMFRNEVQQFFKSIETPYFFIKMDDYLKFIASGQDPLVSYTNRMKFIEHNVAFYLDYLTKKVSFYWNDNQESKSLSSNVKSCLQFKKNPFDSYFLKNIFKCQSLDEVFEKNVINKGVKGTLSHLFHFNTLVTLLQSEQTSWIRIACNNVAQAKVRILVILLKAYSFKKGSALRIEGSQPASCKKRTAKQIFSNQNVYITKGDVDIANSEYDTYIKKIPYKSKIYFKGKRSEKPTKVEEDLLIFFHNPNQDQHYMQNAKSSIDSIDLYANENSHHQKHKAHLSIEQIYFSENGNSFQRGFQASAISINNNFSKRNQSFKRSNTQKGDFPPHPLKKIISLKKEIKSYKLKKVAKNRQNSFIMSSSNRADRVMTEPDVGPIEIVHQQTEQIDEKQLLHVSSNLKEKVSKRHNHIRNLLKSKKQEAQFHSNFMNLNNFLQQQSIAEQRRRIKTEFEISAYESADKVRSQIQKSGQNISKLKKNRMRRVEEDIKLHKQTLQRHRIIKQQLAEQKRIAKSAQKQKKQNNKGKMRRLKVSFAQECFPIVNRLGTRNKQRSSSSVKISNSQGLKYSIG